MGGVFHGHALTALLLSAVAAASTGTSDGLVLCMDPFAALARLGSAADAVIAGPWAASGNPAVLQSGMGASGGTAALESATAGAAAAFSAGGGVCAGVSMHWLGHGGIQGRDEEGMPTGEYSWSSGSLSGGLSLGVLPGLRAGASFGPVWESADDERATGLAASAGVFCDAIPDLGIGLVLENVGSAPDWNGIRKNMPVELSLGASYRPSVALGFVGGASLGFHTLSRLSAAAEFRAGSIAVSGGWNVVPEETGASGPFAGAGYIYDSSGVYRFDIAVGKDEFGWPVLAGLSASF